MLRSRFVTSASERKPSSPSATRMVGRSAGTAWVHCGSSSDTPTGWAFSRTGIMASRSAMTSGRSTSNQSTVAGGSIRDIRVSSPLPSSTTTASGCVRTKASTARSSMLVRITIPSRTPRPSETVPRSWSSRSASSAARSSCRNDDRAVLSSARPLRVISRDFSSGVRCSMLCMVIAAPSQILTAAGQGLLGCRGGPRGEKEAGRATEAGVGAVRFAAAAARPSRSPALRSAVLRQRGPGGAGTGREGAGHRHEAAVLALSVLLVGIAQHRDLGGIGRLDHVLLGIELLVLLAALELLGRQHLRPLPGAHGRQLTGVLLERPQQRIHLEVAHDEERQSDQDARGLQRRQAAFADRKSVV